MDRCGRKLILTGSCVGVAFGLIVYGTYGTLQSSGVDVESTFSWVPLAAFSFAIFISSLGIQPITLMLLVEIMPESIKDLSVSFCLILLWLFGNCTISYYHKQKLV